MNLSQVPSFWGSLPAQTSRLLQRSEISHSQSLVGGIAKTRHWVVLAWPVRTNQPPGAISIACSSWAASFCPGVSICREAARRWLGIGYVSPNMSYYVMIRNEWRIHPYVFKLASNHDSYLIDMCWGFGMSPLATWLIKTCNAWMCHPAIIRRSSV